MATPPALLNDDGSASMATAFLMSHHAFRRDLGCFSRALARLEASQQPELAALRQEWQWFRGALHGHHEMEDGRIFPHLCRQRPELAAVIDRLNAEHRSIDPLLERGDRAFGETPSLAEARATVAELSQLLSAHLAFEEAEIVASLRGSKELPAPATDEEAAMYAQGFAWSSHGIAAEVLARLDAMLPERLVHRLPTARAEFAARWQRVWGDEPTGHATTSVPTR